MRSNNRRLMQTANMDSGFTIIEIMIAIAIFAIGFLAVGLMQINALNKTTSARQTTEAMVLTENHVEWLQALPFYDYSEDLDGDGSVEEFDVLPVLAEADDANPHELDAEGPFTLRWTVVDDEPLGPDVTAAATPVTRTKTIRVWTAPDNNANDLQAVFEFVKTAGKLR